MNIPDSVQNCPLPNSSTYYWISLPPETPGREVNQHATVERAREELEVAQRKNPHAFIRKVVVFD